MKNQIIKAKCIDVTVDYYGICKHNGLVIFVKGMLPGEEGDIKIINLKKNIAYGIIDKLDVKSIYRVKELCPIAYKCGGCDLQYASYDYQLILKKDCLINTFKNMKLDVDIEDVVGAKNIYNYRNKSMVPVCNKKIGFYRNHSNDIVEFDNCYIESEISNQIIKEIKDYDFDNLRHIVIRCNNSLSQYMLCFVVNNQSSDFDILAKKLCDKYKEIKSVYLNINNNKTNVILGEKSILLYGKEYIEDDCLGLTFRIPLNSFYQVNNEQMLNLYKKIVDLGAFDKEENVLDLFCGIGTISLYLSKYVNHVLGIEIVKESVDYALINKSINNIDNVDFVLKDANDIEEYIKKYDAIIIDPPRKGINSKLVDSLINSNINKIIYVSCNPATLARDLFMFKDYYSFSSINPVDMFPNTKHIECVVRLDRKQ